MAGLAEGGAFFPQGFESHTEFSRGAHNFATTWSFSALGELEKPIWST